MKLKTFDSYMVILAIILFVGCLTWLLPAGSYDRMLDPVTSIEKVIPNTWQEVKASPATPFDLVRAIPKGMNDASDIILFILLIGGSFGVVQATGAINSLLKVASSKKESKFKVLLITCLLFSLAGGIFGFSEESLPLYPLIIAMAYGLGFDIFVGAGMILISVAAGFTAGVLNPFNTGIGQLIVGLPLFSGILFRVVTHIVLLSTGMLYLYKYTKSEEMKNNLQDIPEHIKLFSSDKSGPISTKHKLVYVTIILSIIAIVLGSFNKQHNLVDTSAIFLVMAIVSGVICKISSGRMVQEFIKGSSQVLYGALIVGLSRAIMIVMKDGNILDSVVNGITNVIDGFLPQVTGVLMFFTQMIMEFFIPSASAQAAVTLPIMQNIADLNGLTRQTTVLIFQYGDGILNLISPSNGILLAALAISGISWKKWGRFIWKLALIWAFEAVVLITIATTISYGPY